MIRPVEILAEQDATQINVYSLTDRASMLFVLINNAPTANTVYARAKPSASARNRFFGMPSLVYPWTHLWNWPATPPECYGRVKKVS